jgi:hypothetical protein
MGIPRKFFDPPLEELTLVSVSAVTLRKVAMHVLACESCSEDAEIPFDYVLDRVTGSDPAFTDYLLSEPAKCPRCQGLVTEKTLVEF